MSDDKQRRIQRGALDTGGARDPDAGCAVTPLARPGNVLAAAEIRPVVALRVIARIFESDALRRRGREIVAPGRVGQRRQRIGKARGAMRHAVERPLAVALPEPASAVVAMTRLRKQMVAALGRDGEHIAGWTVAIKPQRPRMPPAHPPITSNCLSALIRSSLNSFAADMRVREQIVVPQAPGHHGERIDDRTQPGGAAGAERSRHARRIAALQGLARIGNRRQRQLPGRLRFPSSRHGRRETARCRCCRCKDRRRAARAARPRNPPASRARSRPRPSPCGWRNARALRRSCRLPPGSSPSRGAIAASRRKTRFGFGAAAGRWSAKLWRCSAG